jgi:hypothetical protein
LAGDVPNEDEIAVVSDVRAEIAFENMIVSVLAGSAVAGVAHFTIAVGAHLVAGSFSLVAAGIALVAAVGFTFLFFIAGFGASLAIGVPLYRLLEKAKLRRAWPYCLVATATGLVIATAAGVAPTFEAPGRILYLVPGLAAALIFARKMRPFWAAIEREEREAPKIVALH